MEQGTPQLRYELDPEGIESIPFDHSFRTGHGTTRGHESVFIDGRREFVHTVPNFPNMLNRFFDFFEGRPPAGLLDQVTYQQYTESDMAAAFIQFAERAPNLYRQVLVYREEVRKFQEIKNRGPASDEEKILLFAANQPGLVTRRGTDEEVRQQFMEKSRQAALKRLHYSRSYQVLGEILREANPAFNLKAISS